MIFFAVIAAAVASGILLFYLASEEIAVGFPWQLALLMAAAHTGAGIFQKTAYNTGAVYVLRLLLLLSLLWVCAWTDYKKQLILNKSLLLSILFLLPSFAFEWMEMGKAEFLFSIRTSIVSACMLFGACLLCRVVSSGSVGAGDAKLLFVVGLYAGVDAAISIMTVSFVVLFVVALYLLLVKKVSRKTKIPFAPFILAGALVVSFTNMY